MPEPLPDFHRVVTEAARRVGRETVWSTREAEAQIRGALKYGFSIDQAEQLLRLGVSPVFAAEAFGLKSDD